VKNTVEIVTKIIAQTVVEAKATVRVTERAQNRSWKEVQLRKNRFFWAGDEDLSPRLCFIL
jgi:hypothetical protein